MDDHGVFIIEDQDEGEFEDDEEFESESEDEEEGEEDGDDEEELLPPVVTSPRVSQEGVVVLVDLEDESTVTKSCKESIGSQENGEDDEEEEDQIDGLYCPICIEAWTSEGSHQICCLPCGHIYGLSCIKKWLRQRRGGKCPQCNRRCTLKDIRVLYAGTLCVVDAGLQKKVRSLEAKCASLLQKNAVCWKKEVEAQKREADLNFKLQQLREKTKHLEKLLEDKQRGSLSPFSGYQRRVTDGSGIEGCSGIFTLQREFRVEGGRYFDMDASGDVMLVARRLNGMGGTNLLTKISLVAPNEREDIELPANTKAVRALCIRPHSRLALIASLGKKLSVVSTESNNTVLTYDLPYPAWSCAWDMESPHHVYTGLQNGMILAYDMRQTSMPVECRNGLSCNPVHSLISVPPAAGTNTKTVVTASQIGLCEWEIGGTQESPYLVPESENQGVCISLAHSTTNDIVASFRPKIGDPASSQSLPTPASSSSPDLYGVQGSHIFYKRTAPQTYQKTGSFITQVDSIRLPKSIIVNKPNRTPMFVSANEATSDLVFHDISSLNVVQRIKTRKNQIWDVRCTQVFNSCMLASLSGDVVQLFT